jgi:hypothetical protein
VRLVDDLAGTEEDFDRLARCVEDWDPDEQEIDASPAELSVLEAFLGQSDSAEIGGLELGVAGLVYGLAAGGMVPAASCRGHAGPQPWSDSPVVLFATDERHASTLDPLVRDAGCVFDIDPARPELVAIAATSIANLMALASALVETDFS